MAELSEVDKNARVMRSNTPNRIVNPFQAGSTVRIPKGTVIRTAKPGERFKVAGRTQTVRVFTATDGWIDVWNHERQGRGLVILPTITWPGSGGYWQDVKVTPEFAAANGDRELVLPDLDFSEDVLDVLPSFGAGYDDRFAISASNGDRM